MGYPVHIDRQLPNSNGFFKRTYLGVVKRYPTRYPDDRGFARPASPISVTDLVSKLAVS
jgi:hypothetical protein